MDKRDRVEKEKVLAQYVVDSLNTHNFWAFKVFRDSAMSICGFNQPWF